MYFAMENGLAHSLAHIDLFFKVVFNTFKLSFQFSAMPVCQEWREQLSPLIHSPPHLHFPHWSAPTASQFILDMVLKYRCDGFIVTTVSIITSDILSLCHHGYWLLTQLMHLVGICMGDATLMSFEICALDTVSDNDIINCCYCNTCLF